MTDQEALRAQLKAMIDKSQRALKAAKEHLAEGDADFASSKAYYSVFFYCLSQEIRTGEYV